MITLGGNAELELVDSISPFSEGIIFSVMPPKKSWKNISNLSGGEKTLSSLGVQYTHRNDDLIAESAIEGQRMQKLVEVCTRYWIPSLDLVPL